MPQTALIAPTEDDERYTIAAAVEIASILRTVARKALQVAAYINGGDALVLTSIVDVVPAAGQIVLSAPSQEPLTRALAASRHITCLCSLDGVKVEFVTSPLERGDFDGKSVLFARLPSSLLRLQRREHYRIACSITKPVKCMIPMVRDGKVIEMEISAVDISCGGIAVNFRRGIDLKPGTIHHDCRITLPGVGEFIAALEVCNTFEVTLKNGLTCQRAGCRFVKINQAAGNMLQRYVSRLERERNARF